MIEATMSYSGSSGTEAKAEGVVQSRPSLQTIWVQGRIAVGGNRRYHVDTFGERNEGRTRRRQRDRIRLS